MANDKEKIENIEPKKRGRRAQWTDEKVETMCKMIAQGKSYKEAFTAVRISKPTFYAHLANDKDFSDAVKKAEADYQQWYDAQLVVDCKRSLMELVRGYEYDETTTETGKDARTGKDVTRVKIVHKKVGPNPTALIFALCNRDPEHWQNRIAQDVNGKINVEQHSDVSLANVPDDLLAKVIDAINGK